MPTATIVRTGVANTASVVAALARLGCACTLSDHPAEVADAELLVLPGVGSFGAGMGSLAAAGLVDALRDRIERGRATLAICLGLQLLCAASEESPGVEGLSVLDTRVERFGAGVTVPQFGWNRVESEGGLVEPGFAYYANSYRLNEAPAGWRTAWSDHGGRFVAAIERDAVLACQFHPELSGQWGRAMLRRWLARCGVREGRAAC
ncbi:MAG: imidazole glycerol phosphate synthase subunit HisH [Phycisphaerales bacterium]|nr:imidazole glycerol phosphate synthase subunit HisH [Phycisphaerales bacterium]